MLLSIAGFLAINSLWLVRAYNLDVFNYVRHEGQPKTMYGFSVAMHKEQNTNWWVLENRWIPNIDWLQLFQNEVLEMCTWIYLLDGG